MRISDWSSDVCSSDLLHRPRVRDERLDVGGNLDIGAQRADRLETNKNFLALLAEQEIGPDLRRVGVGRIGEDAAVVPGDDDALAREGGLHLDLVANLVGPRRVAQHGDRKRVGLGTSVSVRLDPGGGPFTKKKKK